MARGRAVLALWLVLLAAGLAVIGLKLRLTTDLSQFLPQSAEPQQRLVLDELREGASARLLMLAIGGEPESRLAELSRELAGALEQSGRFARVLNGRDSMPQEERAMWFRYRYLLSAAPADFSAAALHQAFQARLRELASPLGPFTKQTLAADPTAAFRRLQQQWQGERAPRLAYGAWFADDGRAVLFAETRAGGFDLDAQERNIALIRSSFAGLADRGQAQLQISGAAAIAVASRETIRSESQWLSLAASLTVALILLLLYRSARLWLLSALPLLSAVIAALAVTTLVFGAVHGITLAFGITLLGVAIDYPIHLFSHLQPGVAPRETLQRIWPTLRLGVVSTAAGYLAMITTGFDGLVQLGVFTIAGLLAAAAVTRWVVVLWLPSPWPGTGFGHALPLAASSRLSPTLVVLALVGALGLLWQSDSPLWEEDVAALSPIPASARQQDKSLRDALPVADLNHLLLIRGKDPQTVLEHEEALRPSLATLQQQGAIAGFEMAARWLPSREEQLRRRAGLPDREQLEQAVDQAQTGLPFRDGAFTPFVEQLDASRQLEPLTIKALAGTALEARSASLLFERDGNWWGLVRLSGVRDAQTLSDWAARQSLPGLHYLNLKAATNDLVNGFRRAALDRLGWGALLITLLLWWGLRDPRRLLQVLLPVTTAIAVSVAGLHLLGERLSLFHLTSLLLVLGIGIDYSLFFSRPDAQAERRRTGHALMVCAISTLAVFGILALSRLPVLHAIGLTVFIGVGASYLFAWLSAAHGEPETE